MEPLAIIGFSFRFPQDATSSEKFWTMMSEKRCAATRVPRDRFNVDGHYHSSKNRTDTLDLQEAHFMDGDMGAFDAPFFSISAAEAAAMDPQQRGMLETCYHALENGMHPSPPTQIVFAGIPLESVAGSKTAVFTGCFSDDYRILSIKDPERLSKYAGTGTEFSILANRLSWWFDLRGPSFNLDNACASGLTAFHLACQSLRSRESSMALVGGCNLMSSIEQFLLLSNLSMLSSQGRSFSFDHRANGYGRGEGYGIIVVKTLSEAINNGDCIRAVVRATGANQDGRTPSLTSPSQTAQEALIRETYERAGIDLRATALVESHGTGTAVGDPIEARALGNVLGVGRSPDKPLYIGAVKSNIGHLEGASGIAGIIKTILALERAIIPPNANFEKINPAIDASALNLAFPQEPTPWPHGGFRRASINSFGFGGSNCHVVLDDACNYLKSKGLIGHHRSVDLDATSHGLEPVEFPTSISAVSDTILPTLLTWSASDDNALSRMVQEYTQHFAAASPEARSVSYIHHLAYTLSARRSALPVKSFALVKPLSDLHILPDLASKSVRKKRHLGIAFIFTGQGAQYSQMGISLRIYPAFRASIERASQCLRALGCKWHLLDELVKTESDSRIHEPEYSQPMCTALQIALVDLLRSFGNIPRKVVGHSSGEIAAAYTIGALSFESAMRVAFFRGKASSNLTRNSAIRGAMLAAGLSAAQAAVYLIRFRKDNPSQKVVIACINSPKSVTLAGDEIAISALKTQLEGDDIFARKLSVNVAYHSPHVTLVSPEYRSFLDNLETGEQSIHAHQTMVSSVTGWPIEASELIKAGYWVRNMESPVRFSDAVSQAIAPRNGGSGRQNPSEVSDVLEIGPHSALQGPVMEILKNLNKFGEIRYDSVLNRRANSVDTMMNALGRLYCLGYPADLLAINRLSDMRREDVKVLTDLPSYPFDHSKSYWHEGQRGRDFRFRKEPRLDLLGLPNGDRGPTTLGRSWRKITRLSETPWVQDHVINDTIIYPAAGMLCMALEAVRQIADPEKTILAYGIKDVEFLMALTLSSENEGTESQFYIRPLTNATDDEDLLTAEFKLCTLSERSWVENCRGTVQLEYGDVNKAPTSMLVPGNIATCTRKIDTRIMYDNFHAMGMQYGPTFQCIDNIHVGESRDASADINVFQWLEEPQDHIIHPVTLDCIFHPTLIALLESTEGSRTAVPTKLRNLWLSGAGINHRSLSKVQVHAQVEEQTLRTMKASLQGTDANGRALVTISSLEVTFVDDGRKDEVGRSLQHMCYNIVWKPDIDLLDSSSAPTYFQSRPVLVHSEGSENLTYHALDNLMELMAFKRPGLIILEIGAGDGSNAYHILKSAAIRAVDGEALPTISRYDFTDILPDLVDAAKEKFRNESIDMKFSVLDIYQSPLEQGFQQKGYDVVVVTSAIITSSVAILNIRELLKNDGKLVVLNATKDELSNQRLCQNVFSETDFVICDGQNAVDRLNAIAISTVIDDNAPEITCPDTVIVVNEEALKDAQMTTAIVAAIRSLGKSSVTIATLREISTIDLRDKFCICLAELTTPIMANLDEPTYLTLRSWLSTAGGVLWVRDNSINIAELHMITGVVRVCRSENPNAKYVTYAVDNTTPSSITVSNILRIFQKTITSSVEDIEPEYEERDGFLSVNRAIPAPYIDKNIRKTEVQEEASSRPINELPPLKLNFNVPGSLSSISLLKDTTHEEPVQSNEIEIEVKAISLNGNPHLTTLGRVDVQASFTSCAGIVTNTGCGSNLHIGQPVFGLSRGIIQTFSRGHHQLFTPIPNDTDFEKAAAMAMPFVIAYLALVQNAGLRRKEKVLIENAATLYGQAAIQVAQYLGACIVATIEDEHDRQTLMVTYSLPAEAIFLSKERARILSVRSQRPTEIEVLISFSSSTESWAASDIMAPFGRIVFVHLNDGQSLPTYPLGNGSASLSRLNISDLISHRSEHIRLALEAVSLLLRGNIIHPGVPITVHPISSIKQAFSEARAASNMGYHVIQIDPDSIVEATLPKLPSYSFPSNATYVLVGGFGGIGPTICRWMASRGAMNFIILSRSGPSSTAAKLLLEDLVVQNVHVEHPNCDISSKEQVEAALAQCAGHLPPIKGCLQASLVLQDSVFETMTYKEWTTAVNPRIQGTLNLHTLLPKDMDFFILLSSINGILGARFQANYAASNTFLDAFAHTHYDERVVSIDMGWYSGTLTSNDFLKGRFDGLGCVYEVSDEQLLGLLDYYCDPTRKINVESSQTMIGVAPPSYARMRGREYPELLKRPIWRVMNALDTTSSISEGTKPSQRKSLPLSTLLASTQSISEAIDLICNTVTQKLAAHLGIQEEIIDKEKPVHAAGADSLMAVELRTWFKKEVGVNVSVFEIMGNTSLEGICAKAARTKEEQILN
ncbi:ketoacyl-synt-domain-containing protein [Melanomma pulvis-pyrius CBS 109.77]|uniref:Ketoacyl-synt-domain-containing protein n=1 Tax=Melanomma pulvis-pyrius CBS 109.77 TaxID=1314802 RepID=A0A6A6XVS4_9PLEO|nr:ketoacyl-synt-domain-containing protein [Melanomma pulvis-pyrius CBS 109.77]